MRNRIKKRLLLFTTCTLILALYASAAYRAEFTRLQKPTYSACYMSQCTPSATLSALR